MGCKKRERKKERTRWLEKTLKGPKTNTEKKYDKRSKILELHAF